jgi:putative glutamine amidotransferase
MGTTRPVCSSFHHQAIDRLAPGLVETGWADDGTIEAVEVDGDGWLVGVQWHPEDTAADDELQQALFDELVRQAERRSAP